MASEETSVYADLKYVNDSSKQVIKIYKYIYKTTLNLAVSCKAIILPLATILARIKRV